MSNDNGPPESQNDLLELTRVRPSEAEVIVAGLRASGIEAPPGVGSVYESVSLVDGALVYVPAEDASQPWL